jgi:ubiquinone/menaquinone biosynthesis C-methylase UbiE
MDIPSLGTITVARSDARIKSIDVSDVRSLAQDRWLNDNRHRAREEAVMDDAKLKAFTQRMVGHVTGASAMLMVDIGRQVGLFETMAGLGAATSTDIAKRAGLVERYVREWLGAMVCGGIVEYDPAARTYMLPDEHAAVLTGSSSRNLASVAAFFPLLSRVMPAVAKAFRDGGGVPYSEYQPDFTDLMDRRSRPRYDEFLVERYLGLPGLGPQLAAGIRVADVGCGTGYCINLMARQYPKSTFVGYDFSEAAITRAREEARARDLTNVSFVVQDVGRLATDVPFNLVTAFDAIHDQIDPAGVLRRIRAALAPGGTFLMLDVWASSNLEDNVASPMATFVYTVSTMHCMTVSLAHNGAGLGTAWGTQLATQMLKEAGFNEVQVFERVDPTNSLYVAR